MDKISSLILKIREVAGFKTQSNEEIIELGLLELLCCESGYRNCPIPDIEFLTFDAEQDG